MYEPSGLRYTGSDGENGKRSIFSIDRFRRTCSAVRTTGLDSALLNLREVTVSFSRRCTVRILHFDLVRYLRPVAAVALSGAALLPHLAASAYRSCCLWWRQTGFEPVDSEWFFLRHVTREGDVLAFSSHRDSHRRVYLIRLCPKEMCWLLPGQTATCRVPESRVANKLCEGS